MERLIGHYRPKTIEIAERFKFFKRNQGTTESATEFIAELRSLAKTCNFGEYLEIAIRDQFVCGLGDSKCQAELLCEAELTADRALQWARAAEVVCKETEGMQLVRKEPERFPLDGETNRVYSKPACYRCGKQGHSAADCRFKTAQCHACQKTGHLARVCLSRQRATPTSKSSKPRIAKGNDVHQLQEDDSTDSTEGYLHTICQLGDTACKFTIPVCINGVKILVEVDSCAEHTTMPWSVYQEKLVDVCHLTPTAVTLHQYDQSPLTVKGQ